MINNEKELESCVRKAFSEQGFYLDDVVSYLKTTIKMGITIDKKIEEVLKTVKNNTNIYIGMGKISKELDRNSVILPVDDNSKVQFIVAKNGDFVYNQLKIKPYDGIRNVYKYKDKKYCLPKNVKEDLEKLIIAFKNMKLTLKWSVLHEVQFMTTQGLKTGWIAEGNDHLDRKMIYVMHFYGKIDKENSIPHQKVKLYIMGRYPGYNPNYIINGNVKICSFCLNFIANFDGYYSKYVCVNCHQKLRYILETKTITRKNVNEYLCKLRNIYSAETMGKGLYLNGVYVELDNK